MLVSKKTCPQLNKLLAKQADFKFLIEKTRITLRPAGYTYQMPDSSECFIGISPIPDDKNHYRFGTIFLRNFYMALDYENKNLGFAQNVDMWDDTTQFAGRSSNPAEKSYGMVIIVAVFLLGLTTIAVCIYFKTKKSDQRSVDKVVFDHENQTVPRYRDGVEIKPSEQEANVNVPLTTNQGPDDQLLD